MNSYQNLALLQNLYRLKSIGFNYIDPFSINIKTPAIEPTNIQELTQSINSCHLCDLSKSRTQSMSGYGNRDAKLMIIDFSVSNGEDSSNSYYVGNSGDILNNMITKVLNLSKEDIYFTHLVKCKTLNSNPPSSSEISSCKSYIDAQIEYIKPKIIVTLGEESYSHLTSDKQNFETVRGHIIEFKEYKLIPIYHPQHLLRNPNLKKTTFNDLKTIENVLKEVYTK